MRYISFLFLIVFTLISVKGFSEIKGITSRYEYYKFANQRSLPILNCNSFFNSTELLLFLNAYGNLKGVGLSMWHDYRPERHSSVLTNIETGANCAVVISGGKVVARLSLKTPISIQNGLFDFYISKKNAAKFPVELSDYLKQSKIDLSLVYNLSLMKLGNRAPGDDQKLTLQEYLDVYVHELYHLLTAIPSDMNVPGGLKWPTWAKMPDRWQIAKLCYISEKAKPFYLKEKELAMQMINNMFLVHNQNLAMENARQYIQYRKSRYQAVANVRVPSAMDPGGVSCEKADAIMEMVEGTAQYVGVGTMLVLKFYNFADVLKMMNYDEPNAWFYYSALAQMLVVNRLSSNLITIITKRLSQSSSSDRGVFFEFQKIVGSY